MLRGHLPGLVAGAATAVGVVSPALADGSPRIGDTIARTGLFAAATPSQEQAYVLENGAVTARLSGQDPAVRRAYPGHD